jgi:5'-nucleotidase/UDP-sugar diphosphatase
VLNLYELVVDYYFICSFLDIGLRVMNTAKLQKTNSTFTTHFEITTPNPKGCFRELIGLTIGPGSSVGCELPPWLDTSKLEDWILHIIHVNDIHHHHFDPGFIGSVDYIKNQYATSSSMNSFGLSIPQEFVYLSSGDEFTGTVFDELLGYNPEEFIAAPAYQVQSLLGLDASVLGNHDFDRGPAILEKAASQAHFPLISNNIVHSDWFTQYYHGVIGLTQAGLRVGITGSTTPEQLYVPPRLDSNFKLRDPIQATIETCNVLSKYCDVIIILSHLGFTQDESRHKVLLDDRKLAEELSKSLSIETPMIILGGHTHSLTKTGEPLAVLNSIPIFQHGCNGEHVGIITLQNVADSEEQDRYPHDFHIDESDNERNALILNSKMPIVYSGRLRLTLGTERLLVLDYGLVGKQQVSIPESSNSNLNVFIPEELSNLHEMLTNKIDKPLIHIGRVDEYEDETLVKRLCGESALVNLITDQLAMFATEHLFQSGEKHKVIVMIDASGCMGGILPKQDNLTLADVYRILPYADSLYTTRISGKQLSTLLFENCTRVMEESQFNLYGGNFDPKDWSKVAKGFLHCSKNVTINFKNPRSIALVQSQPLVDSQEYCLVVNSFTGLGNQGWEYWMRGLCFSDTGIPLRLAFLNSLKKHTRLDIKLDGRFQW